jgi:pimeloyl-ACP methyl ester carboxylesterase
MCVMSTGVNPPTRLGTVLVPDGRVLGWAEWGPALGHPVLFCPGAATSRWLGFGGDDLGRLGVRLISVDRPGLGASTGAPGRTLDDWASDVAHLARVQGLPSLAAVGFSQGAPLSLACAAAGVVSAVAVVSGTDELAHPAVRARLEPGVARLVEQVAADLAGARALLEGMTAEKLREMVLAGSGPADLAVYTEPTFAAAYGRALREAFSQGPAGYTLDTLLTLSPWPFAPEDIRVPVDLWYGDADKSPVHSPDLGATLAARLPHARRHVVPGAGGALPWTHGGAILEALLRATARPVTR